MGWVNFQRHAATVRNSTAPERDRCWALRSCCYSVASLVRGTVSTNELVLAIAQIAHSATECEDDDKIIITSRLEVSLDALVNVRDTLLQMLRLYDTARRQRKRRGKSFPVTSAFTRSDVNQVLQSFVSHQ